MQVTYIKQFNVLLQNMQLTKQYHTSFMKLRIIKNRGSKACAFPLGTKTKQNKGRTKFN